MRHATCNRAALVRSRIVPAVQEAHGLTVSPGPSFARGLWRIAAADVSSGNRVRLLRDGPATFEAMLELIANAQHHVVLESYIFRSDMIGERFATALLEAAQRGVETRVLMDWIGIRGTSRSFIAKLRKGGIAVRVFNPPTVRPFLVPRDHRKLLVVDDTVGVTGGVGIGREWAMGKQRRGRTISGSHWRDTAVRIEGPAAQDMKNAFEDMWRRADKGSKRERRGSQRMVRRRARGAYLDPATDTPSLVGIIEGEPLRLRVARSLQMQAIAAERSIWIASAYFVPSPSEVEALTGAARDGVDVRILVPSRNDHPWVTMLTRRYYRRLLANGVRIWEWKGEMMHAKSSVVDGRWVRVGSTDFNPLGVSINYELDAVIQDSAIGAEAESMFLNDLAESKEIVMENRRAAK